MDSITLLYQLSYRWDSPPDRTRTYDTRHSKRSNHYLRCPIFNWNQMLRELANTEHLALYPLSYQATLSLELDSNQRPPDYQSKYPLFCTTQHLTGDGCRNRTYVCGVESVLRSNCDLRCWPKPENSRSQI